MHTLKPSILVIDDEPNVLLTVTAILQQEGYNVDGINDGAEAIKAIHKRHYDLVLTDLKMPGVDGLAVLAEVRKLSPSTVTVMMTGFGSVNSALEALQLGAYEYLLKPTDVSELKAAVRRSLERKRFSEIDTLYKITRTFSRSLDKIAICEVASEAARHVLGVGHACLVTFGRESAGEDCPEPLREIMRQADIRERLQDGVIITSGQASLPADEWAATAGISSYAFVPGIAAERLVCVLYADNGSEEFDFHPSAQRFLQALASQAALSLDNAFLIAELKKNNKELARANRRLRDLDKLKSQFLSIATHELRTPLSIILGYNSMLSESLADRLTDEERDTLSENISACNRLIRLVNSMLNLSQIESGKMKMNYYSADLSRIVNTVVSLFQHEARNRGIKINSEIPLHLPQVRLDPERIEQVLINLVGNALKFTKEGGNVSVGVRHVSDSKRVEIYVRDTGIGIAPEDQARVFDEFGQIRIHNAKPHGDGTGLGLSIVRRIVEAHGGTIHLNSVPGVGSIFSFTLPIESCLTHPESPAFAS